jgi:UDP-3-O-[3-hydroxymyristoyl] glucosamine N-acyltransferase
MDKKFELTDETIVHNGRTLHRIRALKDFSNVKKVKNGDLGGFVEKESNLSQEGNCWIYNDAKVYDYAEVYNDAIVCVDAEIYSNAKVYGNAKIFNNTFISGNAEVYGDARVLHDAQVFGNAKVYDSAWIYDNAKVADNAIVCHTANICGDARILGDARVFGNARVCGNARLYGFAEVGGCAEVFGNAKVEGNAKIYDSAMIFGGAIVCGNAIIKEQQFISVGTCVVDLSKNLKENIRCQTNLIPQKDYVIAYKQVRDDLTSFYDHTFQYKIGEWVEVENPDMSKTACASGLHFSNPNYWNKAVGGNTVYLIAKIMLNDIITIQHGKIRCKRAFILDKYEIED